MLVAAGPTPPPPDTPPVQLVDPALLEPSFTRDLNPRVLADMTRSVGSDGVLVPLQVARRRPDGKYPILDGLTRWTAAVAARLDRVPVQEHEGVTTRARIAEWVSHAEIKSARTDAELGLVFMTIRDENGLKHDKDVAARSGHHPSKVCRCLLIYKQPDDVIELLKAGRLTTAHFAAARKCPDPDRQAELLRRAAAGGLLWLAVLRHRVWRSRGHSFEIGVSWLPPRSGAGRLLTSMAAFVVALLLWDDPRWHGPAIALALGAAGQLALLTYVNEKQAAQDADALDAKRLAEAQLERLRRDL